MWIPPKVDRELQDVRRQHEAALMLMSESDPITSEFSRQVEQIDPNLAVVKAKPVVRAGVPMKPGYYHLIRRNEGAPWSVAPIEGERGEFIEPGSKVLDKLRGQDLQNPQVRADLARREQQRRDDERRELERDREARDLEVLERVQAATRAQVSMSTDSPWSQNAAGRRGARK